MQKLFKDFQKTVSSIGLWDFLRESFFPSLRFFKINRPEVDFKIEQIQADVFDVRSLEVGNKTDAFELVIQR